jgi:hypothetical protein
MIVRFYLIGCFSARSVFTNKRHQPNPWGLANFFRMAFGKALGSSKYSSATSVISPARIMADTRSPLVCDFQRSRQISCLPLIVLGHQGKHDREGPQRCAGAIFIEKVEF